MIPLLRGWARVVRADTVILRALDRPLGDLRYREVYGPLRPIRKIVEERLAVAALPMSTIVKQHAPERITTAEGEYAALVRVDLLVSEGLVARAGATPGLERPAVRVFAATFAEHFTTLLDGVCLVREHFDEFLTVARGLTVNTGLMLGTRRRRFVYRRPPGWQALATAYTTRYIPPDYPNQLAMISVHPAMPSAGRSHWFVESIASDMRDHGAAVTQVGVATPVSIAGLDGHRWKIESQANGRPREHVAVVLQDKHYFYRLRLDHAPGNTEALAALDAVLASIEPIPDSSTSEEAAELFGHLVD